ncbi:MAG: F0F1 ATP synthase subunit alpha, partial [Burkholderiales bacterium]|nr:F0F1 ATP synthase subunit alpha [Burkholderiales bacterium]
DIKSVLPFERGLREALKTSHGALIARIEETKDLSKDDEAALHAAIKDFKKTGAY